jgi:hypothetical protein
MGAKGLEPLTSSWNNAFVAVEFPKNLNVMTESVKRFRAQQLSAPSVLRRKRKEEGRGKPAEVRLKARIKIPDTTS